MINNTKTLKAMAEAAMRLSREMTGDMLDAISSSMIQKDINEDKGLVGVRHAGDFCDGCACDDKVCETCPWAQYVPDTRK